jgi:hypothetical protein
MELFLKWVKTIGTLMIGIAGIIVSCRISTVTSAITETQFKLSEDNKNKELEITRMGIENETEIKSIELFLDLIKSDSQREQEMAVRLLSILDKELALKLAISIASNKSENRDIALTAFRIGKQIDAARFLEDILKIMNISLSDRNQQTVCGYLSDPYSGYQQLAEVLYRTLDRSTLVGQTVPIDNINKSVLDAHNRRENEPILEFHVYDPAKVKNAIFARWSEKNANHRARSFEDIIY